ncbi:MAG: DUF2190 family protein [Candidatus Aminicenantes bacterium]|nr:DUF2190 family protein [Candidatus Aminicenantes bacterium]
MNQTQQPGKIISLTAAAAIDNIYRFVGMGGSLCGAGAKAAGINQIKVEAGDEVALATNGKLLVEAGGVVTAGAKIKSDAEGRAVDHDTGEVNGWALTGVTTAGEYVLIVPGMGS